MKMNFPTCLLSQSILPLSLKNLRSSALIIGVVQVMIAHVAMFVMLLALSHAEEMSSLLQADIAEQKEKEWFDDTPGQSLNSYRFNQASNLSSITLLQLYIGTGIASIYLICCLGLLIGTLKNRPELMIPWLVINIIGAFAFFWYIILETSGSAIEKCLGGRLGLNIICVVSLITVLMVWMVVYTYFLNLRYMNNLTEVATVPIPCPAPGSKIPYHYSKENMHLGSGGYKHLLTDPNSII